VPKLYKHYTDHISRHVRLNSPLHTQHNKGVEGCNEDNPNIAIRRLAADRNVGGISNIYNYLIDNTATCFEHSRKGFI
jgi:hypothetical protein